MRFCIGLVLLLAGVGALADESLEGVYERVSLTNVRTGESPEAANRKGLLILAAGHYSMMTMNPERRVATTDEQADMAPDEEIEFLREWLDINGHTGRYSADGGQLTWHRDISEDPKEVGTTSRLNYEWRNDRLVIWFTLPNGDRYDWVWQRVE